MSLVIKTYFGLVNPEIRRFCFTVEFPDLEEVVSKIREVYKIDSAHTVGLQWLDSEGDKITFTTLEEFHHACALVTGHPLKIYVSVPSLEKPSALHEAALDIRHPGIMCDGCDQPLRGYRMKCAICRDYDLCCTCLTLGKHSHHPMILIRRPRRKRGWCQRRREDVEGQTKSTETESQSCKLEAPGICTFNDLGYNPDKEDVGTQKSPCRQAKETMVNMMSSVSTSLQTILSPYGIDVSFQVDKEPPGVNEDVQEDEERMEDIEVEEVSSFQVVPDAEVQQEAAESPEDVPVQEPVQDEAVKKSLQQMLSMGFCDTDGWLTAILVSNGGDIAATLDAISSSGDASTLRL